MLRTLGCDQDATSSILHCGKGTVVGSERWIETCPLDEATGFCDNAAIKRLVGREFPLSPEISPELLVKAGQVTGDDVLRHYREDYLRVRVKHEEKEKLLVLLQHWRGQLDFLSVSQFLRKFYFDNRRKDAEIEITESEDVNKAYLDVAVRHWDTMPRHHGVMLPIESENSFQWLKKSYPTADVWQAQESYCQIYGTYLDAYIKWIGEVKQTTELIMELAASENDSGNCDTKVANLQQRVSKVIKRKPDAWLFLRLLSLTVACDLLLFGLEEQLPNVLWAQETLEIKKLRDDVVLTSIRELPEDFRLTGGNRIYPFAKLIWDREDTVKEKTITLVNVLNKLQITQTDVRIKLNALEHTLI